MRTSQTVNLNLLQTNFDVVDEAKQQVRKSRSGSPGQPDMPTSGSSRENSPEPGDEKIRQFAKYAAQNNAAASALGDAAVAMGSSPSMAMGGGGFQMGGGTPSPSGALGGMAARLSQH